MNFRQEISSILGFTITPDQWERDFHALQVEGRITQKQLIQIILVIIKRLEAQEK